jgi:hypothetical protein
MVLGVVGSVANATEAPSITRASGESPFPEDGCGQADHAYYGSQRGMESDVSLAADPEDATHLVAAWIQDEGFGIVTATSFDGGATWTRAVVPNVALCSGGPAQRVVHARLAFGPGGHVWVTGEVLDGYFPDPRSGLNGVPVSASTDGGLTWSPAVRVETFPVLSGLNHIAADPSSPGSVVVSWHALEPFATSYVSRSDDAGATWHATAVPAYAHDALPFHRLVIGPDGTYYLFTVEGTLRSFPKPSAPLLSVQRSNDRGATWTPRTTIARKVAWQWPTGAMGPDGTLYAQWLVEEADGTQSLRVARSVDGGTTWSAPVVAAKGHIGPEPSFAVTATGVLASGYTTGTGGQRVLRLTRSTDRGATWTTSVVDGPYTQPANEGFYNETVAMADGSLAVVYTKAGPGSDGPTDAYVAVIDQQP